MTDLCAIAVCAVSWAAGALYLLGATGIPGAETAIESASKHSYEAVIVVIIIIVGLGGGVWLFRIAWVRETRLAERVTRLEDKLEKELIELVKDTTAQLGSNSAQLAANLETNTRLTAAIDSWRKFTETSGNKIEEQLRCFSEKCEERWAKAVEDRLPEALRMHLPAVIEAYRRQRERDAQ